MTRVRSRSAAVAVALLATTAGSPGAYACGYDAAMPDLAALHPRSIAVAVAVRSALDREQLSPLPVVPASEGFMRATGLLRDFAPQVPFVAGVRSGAVAVLLIDAGLWSRFHVTGRGVEAELHVEGGRDGEPVIVTSEAVLVALAQGTLTLDGAIRSGILAVARP